MPLLFLFFPQFVHVFERFAFGLGNELPYKDGGDDADDAVKGVGKHVAELLAHVAGRHVIHGYEGRRYDEVEYPLEGYGYGYGRTTYGVGEDFGDEYPADGSPREHERGRVDHDADYRHDGRQGHEVAQGYHQGGGGHTYGAGDKQRLAAQLLDREYGQRG